MSELVFVYGTLKQGCSNHHWMDKAPCLGSASTVAHYALYTIQYPFLYDGQALYPVEGEVYRVSMAGLHKLDILEAHPDDYCRRQIPVRLSDGAVVQAWTYFHPQPTGVLLERGVFEEVRR
ncbi:Uncharacterized conserved protein YtfP, gamma-glutamylcyclotransferase (GGCT)/AIG2-like family [Andreprevotia lacus DSM 23236]|jgi:gamma-glutamylaminecyclotransferase|uniref:Gamma-glutamylcyclotransferase family protein n=1 Tax=Andreprevotia lacus DSM 23236 TaxID=1121001 RepID=A0A1W1XLW4_9NEIS|nr:gamma-glutamylcyclotransferase family protein [Andreprevotia lacus]SMC24865.1 Uncharacterized conserved protein YtfP, gamma-glutamylcyclotransferase (GGCT)/AIG2-like family [Andreprevotia lacus DSM 23236]